MALAPAPATASATTTPRRDPVPPSRSRRQRLILTSSEADTDWAEADTKRLRTHPARAIIVAAATLSLRHGLLGRPEAESPPETARHLLKDLNDLCLTRFSNNAGASKDPMPCPCPPSLSSLPASPHCPPPLAAHTRIFQAKGLLHRTPSRSPGISSCRHSSSADALARQRTRKSGRKHLMPRINRRLSSSPVLAILLCVRHGPRAEDALAI